MNVHRFFEYKIFSKREKNKDIIIKKILYELYNNKKNCSYTHYINNRWENIYLTPSKIPSILPLLSYAISLSLKCYNKLLKPHQTLIIPHELLGYEKNEFWFNLSHHGESTRLHNHNQKAIISGVFYLKAPKKSGNIIFKDRKNNELEINVEKGKIILFPSELDHYVPKNKSQDNRISFSFNCYKFPLLASI